MSLLDTLRIANLFPCGHRISPMLRRSIIICHATPICVLIKAGHLARLDPEMENSDEKDASGGHYRPYAGRQRCRFRTAACGNNAAELRLVSYSELILRPLGRNA